MDESKDNQFVISVKCNEGKRESMEQKAFGAPLTRGSRLRRQGKQFTFEQS